MKGLLGLPREGCATRPATPYPSVLPNQPTEPVEPGGVGALFIAAQDILKLFQLGRLVVDGTALGPPRWR